MKQQKTIAILGAGLSGLSAAWNLRQQYPEAEIKVFESSDRPGGKVLSKREENFLFECGPNGFLSSRKAISELCEKAGLVTVQADPSAAIRYIQHQGKLLSLPQKPPQMLSWKGLKLGSRLRLFADLWKKPRKEDDESVAVFLRKQFGDELVQRLADPFVTGVFAADVNKLSMRSAFPDIFKMQREYGSIIRGIMKKIKEQKAQGTELKPGRLSTLPGGMQDLTQKLADDLGPENLLLNHRIISVKSRKNRQVSLQWIDESEQTHTQEFDACVLAINAPATPAVLESHLPQVAALYRKISCTSIGVCALGFDREDIGIPKGYGYLVPSSENGRILGCLFSSGIFRERAPQGKALLRVMFAGQRHAEMINFSDEQIRSIVLDELKEHAGLQAEPSFIRVSRWKNGIPMYTPGHHKTVAAIEQSLKNSAIFPCGSSLYGVSMNDCCESGAQVARQITHYFTKETGESPA